MSDESRERFLKHLTGEMGRAGYCNYDACREFLDRAYQEGEDQAERDTRELCAQQVREILTGRLCADFSPEFVNDVAERIRGKGEA